MRSLLISPHGEVPMVGDTIALVDPQPGPQTPIGPELIAQEVPRDQVAIYGSPQRPVESWALRAIGIVRIAQQQRYHPTTGEATTLKLSGKDAGVSETSDGAEVFPRIDPAIICRVTSPDNHYLLLGRNALRSHYYSLIAGYVGLGENIEDATVREVKEETDLDAYDISYVCSQSWPFSGALMLGMQAHASGEPYTRDGELLEVSWFSAREIVHPDFALPQPHSIAYRLIKHWINQHD
ncbi:MAG: NAD(+) diphosphatase [Corynebacterium sp.]|nr:NAD(+) diphosphatase [Corynebacterium sp.]